MGHGLLFAFDKTSAASVLAYVEAGDVIHLELECDGAIQVAAYDAFEHVFFWEGVTEALLTQFERHGVIETYEWIEE